MKGLKRPIYLDFYQRFGYECGSSHEDFLGKYQHLKVGKRQMIKQENDYQTHLLLISLDFLPELPSVSEQEDSFLLFLGSLLRKVFAIFCLISSILSTCLSQANFIFQNYVSSCLPKSRSTRNKSCQRGKRMWVGAGSFKVVKRGVSWLEQKQSWWSVNLSKWSRLLS